VPGSGRLAHADRRPAAGQRERTPKMPQHETPTTRDEMPTLALGLLAFCAGVIVLLLALMLGFHIESSPQADADTAKAQAMAVPALTALVLGVVALAGRRRGWAVTVGWVAVAAAVVAVLLTALLPGGKY
jgi:hypothetical protein